MVSGGNCIHHYREVAARGIFKSYRHVKSARSQSVLLIFNRSRADSNIRKQVGKITVIVGIEHLVRRRETVVTQRAHVKLTDRDNTLEHIGV